MRTLVRLFAVTLAAATLGLSAARAFDDVPIVNYEPSLTIVEGDQPLHSTFVLSITSPFNVAAGQSISITPVIEILNKPENVDDATALSYITLTPSTLTFSNAGQTLTTTVSADFPLGTVAGAYAYKITTPGWADGTQDPGAFINATVYPLRTGAPPSVAITSPQDGDTFTYQPNVGPLSIPLQFTATAPSTTPVTNVDADANQVGVALTSTTAADGTVTASGNAIITAPGIYTFRARASNSVGTGSDTVDVTVNVSAPAPTVAITAPTATTFLRTSGTLTVPFTFTGHSYWGGVTSLSATLNGQPIAVTATGIGSLNATGTGNLSLTAGGSYVLAVTATDANGTASTTHAFNVTTPAPAPTVTIVSPANGSSYTRVAGSAPTVVPFTFSANAANGYTISSLTGSFNSGTLAVTTTGLNTASTIGTGSFSVSGPGTYTLTASAVSGGTTAATSIQITVTETPPPAPTCSLNWLPPISLGMVQQGGSKVAIKFELYCGCENGVDRNGDGDPDFFPGQRTKSKTKFDSAVVIAVSEVFANGQMSAPQLFAHGSGYDIQGNDMYHLNYTTAKGTHRYRIEVYRPRTNAAPELLGTKEFITK